MSLKLDLNIENTFQKQDVLELDTQSRTPAQKVKLLILRDLINLGWNIEFGKKKIEVYPPANYSKEAIKQVMSVKRQEIISKHALWINAHLDIARKNLAYGCDALFSEIDPAIEVCKTQDQNDLFRIFRYFWSSPYSDYVGRRIRLLIRDRALRNNPVIGIAALGSPIIHIPERDDFIGWDKNTRTKNLIYTMDAYVIGALPPYNYLLGGKLVSMLLASDEVRKIYSDKYKDQVTIIDKRVSNQLVGIFTTSLYGKSSQYNRLKYNKNIIYNHIGNTKGYGTLHLSNETLRMMVDLLKSNNIEVNHRFGDGPNWVMRVIRSVGELLGFDPDFLLQHSFKRSIYFVPLAKNYHEVLNGETKRPVYFNYSKNELVAHWKKRWLEQRKKNPDIIREVLKFNPNSFSI